MTEEEYRKEMKRIAVSGFVITTLLCADIAFCTGMFLAALVAYLKR